MVAYFSSMLVVDVAYMENLASGSTTVHITTSENTKNTMYAGNRDGVVFFLLFFFFFFNLRDLRRTTLGAETMTGPSPGGGCVGGATWVRLDDRA